MIVLVAILMIVGPLAAVLFLIGAPLFAGVFAYDAASRSKDNAVEPVATEPEPLRPVSAIKRHRLSA